MFGPSLSGFPGLTKGHKLSHCLRTCCTCKQKEWYDINKTEANTFKAKQKILVSYVPSNELSKDLIQNLFVVDFCLFC